MVKKKKHNLGYHVRRCVLKSYWVQIASLLTFYMIFFLIKCFTKNENFVIQLILSVLTEISICLFVYKYVWFVGDFHSSEVCIGSEKLKKHLGLWIGLLNVAPILICSLLSSVISALELDFAVFQTALSLFVFRWSGVVEYITLWTNGSAFVGAVCYIAICLPLVAVSAAAFKNGFFGVHGDFSLRKRHCEVGENAGAREAWKNA